MIKEQTFIKKDTLENWNKAINFIPKENEVIVYTDLNLKKIGDGRMAVNDLPFLENESFYIDDDDNMLIINSNKFKEG
jgi:hypothetical protein